MACKNLTVETGLEILDCRNWIVKNGYLGLSCINLNCKYTIFLF